MSDHGLQIEKAISDFNEDRESMSLIEHFGIAFVGLYASLDPRWRGELFWAPNDNQARKIDDARERKGLPRKWTV